MVSKKIVSCIDCKFLVEIPKKDQMVEVCCFQLEINKKKNMKDICDFFKEKTK